MNRNAVLAVGLGACLSAGCATVRRSAMTQWSTTGHAAGADPGCLPCRSLTGYGDFGLARLAAPGGQVIVLDGDVFTVTERHDAAPALAGQDAVLATVAPFRWDTVLSVTRRTDAAAVAALVDRAVPDVTLPCAVKVRGRFLTVTTFPEPQPPSPAETKGDVFRFEDVYGTLIGFRKPTSMQGIGPTGYEFAFLSEDRRSGGAVAGFLLHEGSIEVDVCRQVTVVFPAEGDTARVAE